MIVIVDYNKKERKKQSPEDGNLQEITAPSNITRQLMFLISILLLPIKI